MSFVEILACKDVTQTKKQLKIPEIRVWNHPHYIGKKGEDYYYVFDTFKEAYHYQKTHKEAENTILLAINGLELNLSAIMKIKP